MKKLDVRTLKQRRFIRGKKQQLESLEEKINRLESEIGETLAEFEFIQDEIEDIDKVNNQYLKELAVRYNMLSRELKKARDERNEDLEEHKEVKKERVNLQRKTPMYDETINDELFKKLADLKSEEAELERQLESVQSEKEMQRIESELDKKSEERIAIRNQIVENNMRLVYYVLNKERYSKLYRLPDDYTEDDRLQEGYMALIKAVDKFDISKGHRFSTYAYSCIWGPIIRYAVVGDKEKGESRGTMEIPKSSYSKVRKLKAARGYLYQELRREPNAEELAINLNMSTDEVENLLKIESIIQKTEQLSEEFTSLNGFDTISRGRTINNNGQIEEYPDYVDVPFSMAEYSELQDRIESVLSDLHGRERRLLEFRFGLYDGHPGTLEEVGREFGVNRERIRQIESKTIVKLRHPSRSGRMKDFEESDFDGLSLENNDDNETNKADEINPKISPTQAAEVSDEIDKFDNLIKQIMEGSQELDEILDSTGLNGGGNR